jgi:hypothetical protein
MWVSDAAVGIGRIWVQRHNFVFVNFGELPDIQTNLKPSQFNIVQDNRVGGYGDGLRIQITLQ